MANAPDLPTPIGPEQAQENINRIEQALDLLGGEDELLNAMLLNTKIQAEALLSMTATQEQPNPNPGIETGYKPVPSPEILRASDIPIGAVGLANRAIQEADTGPATFQVNGTVFNDTIRAIEDIAPEDAVQIIDGGNIARLRNNVSTSFFGLGRAGPRAADPEATFLVGNQKYIAGSTTDISATLNAGQQKTFAEIQPGRNQDVFITGINQSQHPTVQYRIRVDGSTLTKLTGTSPLAVPPDFFNPPSGVMLVRDRIQAIIEETSGNNSYTDVEATLKGFIVGG